MAILRQQYKLNSTKLGKLRTIKTFKVRRWQPSRVGRAFLMLKWIVILALAASRSSGQTVATPNSFVIDPNRPYAYLKFDHIGPGIQRNEKEPRLRIWLRLVNN